MPSTAVLYCTVAQNCTAGSRFVSMFRFAHPTSPNLLFLSQGSEGVDIKEGSHGNIVYRNEISGLRNTQTGG